MVEGLDVFRKHFREFSDRFLLIGGTLWGPHHNSYPVKRM